MINPIYKIQIDDLTIRCGEPEDAQSKKEAIDSSLDHLHEFMPWSHHEPESIEKKQDRLKRWHKDYIENKDYAVVIFNGNKLVACAGLHNRLNRNALEIGYWVRAEEINKGIATKVSLALTKLALEYIKVDEVEIRHNLKNIASSKIPLKLKYLRQDNFIDKDDGIESARWLINGSIFNDHKKYYSTLFKDIEFFEK